jgi:hypothetical protein
VEIQEAESTNTEAKHQNFWCVLCDFCSRFVVLAMNTPALCFCYSFFDAKMPHFSIKSVPYLDF